MKYEKRILPILSVLCILCFWGLCINTLADKDKDKYWVDPEDMPALEEEYLEAITPKPVDPNAEVVINHGHLILYGQVVVVSGLASHF